MVEQFADTTHEEPTNIAEPQVVSVPESETEASQRYRLVTRKGETGALVLRLIAAEE